MKTITVLVSNSYELISNFDMIFPHHRCKIFVLKIRVNLRLEHSYDIHVKNILFFRMQHLNKNFTRFSYHIRVLCCLGMT